MSADVTVAGSLDEALAALAARPGLRALAGGTDLMVERAAGRMGDTPVLDLWRVRELRGIREEAGGIRIGALTTCSELLRAAGRLAGFGGDVIGSACRCFAAAQIRNRATVGGNLGTASPAADLNPLWLLLDGVVRLRSARGARDVPAGAFFTGYRRTERAAGELIDSLWLPARPPGERRTFRKVGTRAAQAIGKVILAARLRVEDGRIVDARAVAGSVAPTTVALPSFSGALVGHPPTAERFAAAGGAVQADVAPIDDVRSTASYRREVLARLCRSLAGPPVTPR